MGRASEMARRGEGLARPFIDGRGWRWAGEPSVARAPRERRAACEGAARQARHQWRLGAAAVACEAAGTARATIEALVASEGGRAVAAAAAADRSRQLPARGGSLAAGARSSHARQWRARNTRLPGGRHEISREQSAPPCTPPLLHNS